MLLGIILASLCPSSRRHRTHPLRFSCFIGAPMTTRHPPGCLAPSRISIAWLAIRVPSGYSAPSRLPIALLSLAHFWSLVAFLFVGPNQSASEYTSPSIWPLKSFYLEIQNNLHLYGGRFALISKSDGKLWSFPKREAGSALV